MIVDGASLGMIHRLAKELRRQLCQISPPHAPRVRTFRHLVLVSDPLSLKPRGEFIVPFEQGVFLAGRDPEKLGSSYWRLWGRRAPFECAPARSPAATTN